MSMGKRLFDATAAIAALAIFSPVLIVAASLIRHEDGDPVLFRQVRIGRQSRPFVILKLRTMRDGQHVTKIGRWLRRTGIDEIPQFINVLRGDLSVAGALMLSLPSTVRLAAFVCGTRTLRNRLRGQLTLGAAGAPAHSEDSTDSALGYWICINFSKMT